MSYPKMKSLLLITGVFTLLISCSLNRTRDRSETVDFFGEELYSFKLSRLDNYFPQIASKDVLYRQSFLGKFTLLYDPTVLNTNIVEVPKISCYSAYLDFPEKEIDEHQNHVRCYYYKTMYLYTQHPRFIYGAKFGVDKRLARKIAASWYDLHTDGRFISYISKINSEYYVFENGGQSGCSISYKVSISPDKLISFIKSDFVSVCS